MRNVIHSFALLSVLFCFAWSGILHVPQNYPTIQGAINAAQNHDTVLVAEGTYFENIRYYGKSIVVASNFFTTRDWQTVRNTVIDGSTCSNKDTASTVQFLGREDSAAILDGFTITGGTGTRYMFPYGTGAAAYQEGAGIVMHYSSAIVKNNIITRNIIKPFKAGTNNGGGGGIASMYGNPTICNNIIMLDTAGYAGGIVLNWSGGKVRNNIISHNTATGQYGNGGIMVWQVPKNSAWVENNTVVGNSSTGDVTRGAGGINIYVTDPTAIPVVRNNIVWGNRQITGGQVASPEYGSYNDIQDYTGGTNFSSDPCFQDSSSFMLAPNSPCIDAGDPSGDCSDPANPLRPDSALYPSQGGLRNDAGAYGGMPSSKLGTAVQHGTNSLERNFRLYQNYPNPFNPSTRIGFSLLHKSQVKLTVFDILGKEIACLVNAELGAGEHSFTWNPGSTIGSGVYFTRLASTGSIEVRKVLFQK